VYLPRAPVRPKPDRDKKPDCDKGWEKALTQMPGTGLPVAREVTCPEMDPAPRGDLARTASMRLAT
jgi:hypothetical protein